MNIIISAIRYIINAKTYPKHSILSLDKIVLHFYTIALARIWTTPTDGFLAYMPRTIYEVKLSI